MQTMGIWHPSIHPNAPGIPPITRFWGSVNGSWSAATGSRGAATMSWERVCQSVSVEKIYICTCLYAYVFVCVCVCVCVLFGGARLGAVVVVSGCVGVWKGEEEGL